MNEEPSIEAPAVAVSAPPISVKFEEFIAAMAMALLCVITMANVIVRYFTNISFAFTEEISVWLMVVMTLIGAAAAFVKRQHIAITYFADRLEPPARYWVGLMVLVACAAMFGLLAVFGVRMAWEDYHYEVTSPALDVPQWLYTVWLPVLSFVVLVRLAQMIIEYCRGGRP
jgi:TRAP-type C4-dicarboxylate transport system permease small subunit